MSLHFIFMAMQPFAVSNGKTEGRRRKSAQVSFMSLVSICIIDTKDRLQWNRKQTETMDRGMSHFQCTRVLFILPQGSPRCIDHQRLINTESPVPQQSFVS